MKPIKKAGRVKKLIAKKNKQNVAMKGRGSAQETVSAKAPPPSSPVPLGPALAPSIEIIEESHTQRQDDRVTPEITLAPEPTAEELASPSIQSPAPVLAPKQDAEDTQRHDLQGEIEAILFAAGKPMSVDTIAILTGARRGYVKKALQVLKEQYEKKGGALFLHDEGDNWKFTVKERFSLVVRKIVPDTELSKSILETLAVIAWRSPISQAELVRIRSTKTYDHVPQLEESGFIIKERKGRTYQLRVTQKFYDYFELEGHGQIAQVFHGIPEQQEQKAKIKEMQKEMRSELKQQEQKQQEHDRFTRIIESGAAQVPQFPDTAVRPGDANEQDGMSSAVFPDSGESAIPRADLPSPDDDMDDFLRKIDEKIEGIAQSHNTIEMTREQYDFEQAQQPQERQEQAAEGESGAGLPGPVEDTQNAREGKARQEEVAQEHEEEGKEQPAEGDPDDSYDKRLGEKIRTAMEREKMRQEKDMKAADLLQKPTKSQSKKRIMDQLAQLKEKPKRLSALRRKK